jgi:DNA polymerase I-like protein with 3'-5' exonuclease and polymerase domains
MTRYVILFIENQWHSLNLDQPKDYQEVHRFGTDGFLITFQSPELLRHLKKIKRVQIIPEIVDLEGFEKQMGQEGKDIKSFKNWTMLAALKYYNIATPDFKLSRSTIRDFLGYMAVLYELLLNKDAEETKRFKELEYKINHIIYRRQLLGIPIDFDVAQNVCTQLEQDIYRTKNILQLKYRIFNPDNQDWQKQYLAKKGYKLIKSPLFTFKSWRNEDGICQLMYEMIRNQRDLDSLMFMHSHWGSKANAYPKYLGFGTITSRITMKEPSFQNLRKSNRKVVVADSFHKLLYVDYSQFEAGILASLSGDNRLIDLYNSDIYSDLAKFVFDDETKRSDAKVIFYRFIYGDTTLNTKSLQYFKRFSDLQVFKAKIDQEMQEKAKVGTSSANFRYRGEEEVSWALSHVIQATASLIYKRAVVRVFVELDRAKFLIPMHDGTVYQIADIWYDELKPKIEKIYIEEFERSCPKIKGKVNTTDTFN